MKIPQLPRDKLNIAILGPGDILEAEYKKRKKIQRILKKAGYKKAFLGEKWIGKDSQIPYHLALLNRLPDIDLILVLNADVAPIIELATLSRSTKGRRITRVWSKQEYRSRRRSTPQDVLKMFENRYYSPVEFADCTLTDDFLETTDRICLRMALDQNLITIPGN